MAMMGILTIGSALFADLVFLPALLLRFAGKNEDTLASATGNDDG